MAHDLVWSGSKQDTALLAHRRGRSNLRLHAQLQEKGVEQNGAADAKQPCCRMKRMLVSSGVANSWLPTLCLNVGVGVC